eukprot:CAMPEP_0168425024 /NCGR_PEP_ID=MMETSP0228-20121227/35116_1 /TAXON_ID=133427 /ORGANISM="Protoceratium reticulatum, Strain CCCM 535 (=CCMP 1889)" /LENGTH=60 /DNA_ID=CAMNT_0008439015 /DNA_START=67 /DNA_END=249 /DNA_ORIENTATION=-
MTRFWSTMSTMVHILPSQGPYVMSARRPGSTKRVKIDDIALRRFCQLAAGFGREVGIGYP